MSKNQLCNPALRERASELLESSVPLSPVGFIEALTDRAPRDEHVLVRCIFRKREDVRQEFFLPDPPVWKDAEVFIADASKTRFNTYVGLYSYLFSGRSTADDVGHPYAVGADLDCGDGDLKDRTSRPKFRSKAEALEQLLQSVASGVLPWPSIIVDTGNGIQVWWLLEDPSAVTVETWQRVMVKVALELRADMTRAKSAAALMRIPGPPNVKDPDNPKPTRVLDFRGDHHSVSAFPTASEEELRRYEKAGKGHNRGGCARSAAQRVTRLPPHHEWLITELGNAGVGTQAHWDARGQVVGSDIDVCPYCGDRPSSDGQLWQFTSYIHRESLALSCWRASCDASKQSIPFETWIQEYDLDLQDRVSRLLRRDIDEVEQWLAESFQETYLRDGVAIVAGPPGMGKTRYFIRQLARDAAAGFGGTILEPTYESCEERIRDLRAYVEAEEMDIQILLATSITRVCKHGDKMALWVRYSGSWRSVMCATCEYQPDCRVHTQFQGIDRSRTVIVAVHALLPQLERQKMLGSYVVLDEACKCVEQEREWRFRDLAAVSAHRTPWHRARRNAAQVLGEMLQRVSRDTKLRRSQNPDDQSLWFGRYVFGEELQAVLHRVLEDFGDEDVFDYDRSDLSPGVTREAILEGDPEKLCPIDFDDLVSGLDHAAIHVPPGESARFVLFNLRLPTTRVPVVLLDSTAKYTWATMKRYFPGRECDYFEFRVHPSEHATWIHYKTTSYLALRISRELQRVQRSLVHDLQAVIGRVGEWLKGRSPRLGVICPMRIEHDVMAALKALGLTDCVVDHFGNIRGTNEFECVDALVVVGDMIPNINQAAYHASVLRISVDDRIWGLRRAEAVQAAGRARDVRRTADNPVMVFHLSSYWGVSSKSDETMEVAQGRRSDVQELESMVRMLIREYGFVSPQMFNRGSPLHHSLRPTHEKDSGHWLYKYLNNHLCPHYVRTSEDSKESAWKRLRRTIQRVASEEGAHKYPRSVPGHRSQVTVYELPSFCWPGRVQQRLAQDAQHEDPSSRDEVDLPTPPPHHGLKRLRRRRSRHQG